MAIMNPYALGVCLFAAIGTFLFGYDSGIAMTIIAFPSWNVYMSMPSPSLIGGIASAYAGGEALGVLMQTLIADRLGRIRFLQLLCTLTLAGTIIQTASTNISIFIAGRAVTGFGVGGMVTTIPLYLSEIAPPAHRGFIAGFTGVGIAFGVMMSSWVAVACIHAPYGELQWRLPIALQIPWTPILFCGLATFMPESPRVLIQRGRVEEARVAFARVHRGSDVEATQREFALMRAQIRYEREREFVGYWAVFLQYRRRVFAAVGIAVMAILSGSPVVGFYQTILYKALGMKGDTIIILAGARGTLSLISVLLINRFLLDQWGRRQLLLWGMAISACILIYCAVMQMLYQDSTNEVGKGFAVLGIFVFAVFNGGLLESVCPIYNAEILPLTLRSKIMGLAAFVHFSLTVALTEAAPSAFKNIKQNYYYVFVGCTVVMWIIGYFWFPETKNRTLEEIAAAFGDRVVEVERGGSESEVVLVEGKGPEVREVKTEV